ncbi:MAG: 30S ribosomal protein S20 [Dethiobacteria bacterium]
MPTSLSARKRVRQTITRTARNRAIKSRLNTSIRRFTEALENKDEESMDLRFKEAVRTIDKAVSKGVIHKNNAAHKKSRLYKLYQKSREQ